VLPFSKLFTNQFQEHPVDSLSTFHSQLLDFSRDVSFDVRNDWTDNRTGIGKLHNSILPDMALTTTVSPSAELPLPIIILTPPPPITDYAQHFEDALWIPILQQDGYLKVPPIVYGSHLTPTAQDCLVEFMDLSQHDYRDFKVSSAMRDVKKKVLRKVKAIVKSLKKNVRMDFVCRRITIYSALKLPEAQPHMNF
jgi:hypothetical protein